MNTLQLEKLIKQQNTLSLAALINSVGEERAIQLMNQAGELLYPPKEQTKIPSVKPWSTSLDQ